MGVLNLNTMKKQLCVKTIKLFERLPNYFNNNNNIKILTNVKIIQNK